MEKSYLVLSAGEGDIYAEMLSGAAVEQRLAEGSWGHRQICSVLPENDLRAHEGVWIFEARLVTPKAVQTVTEWKL